MRITVSCPAALVDDANNLAMCLAFGPEDANTFRGLNWVDAKGSLYAAASFEASAAWIAFAQAPLARPAWDVDEIIDMDAAGRAQAAMVYWTATDETPAPAASPAHLTAICGPDGPASLAMTGLKEVDNG